MNPTNNGYTNPGNLDSSRVLVTDVSMMSEAPANPFEAHNHYNTGVPLPHHLFVQQQQQRNAYEAEQEMLRKNA